METLKYLGSFFENTGGRTGDPFMKHLLNVYLALGRVKDPRGVLMKGYPCPQGASLESGHVNNDRVIWKHLEKNRGYAKSLIGDVSGVLSQAMKDEEVLTRILMM